MAAEKKGTTIVIKKIYTVAGGHGGSWKVALADFMTAMMAFFLVMWLLNQSEETKKAVSDYFSTPSIIEYNFQNFGAEITLEKLFLDLVNEPLKAFQSFMEPIDRTPNILDMGSQKVVSAMMAEQVGDIAKNYSIDPSGFEFDIIDKEFFVPGTSDPSSTFVTVMTKIQTITRGLSDAEVRIDSRLFNQSVDGSDPALAKKIASQRLDIIRAKVEGNLEHDTVTVFGSTNVADKKEFIEGQSQRPPGFIHIKISQKELKADGQKMRKLDEVFGTPDKTLDVYDNFVKQISNRKAKQAKERKELLED